MRPLTLLLIALLCLAPAGADVTPTRPNQATTLADLRGLEARVKSVVGRVMPAVVGLQAGYSQGSGVIVSPDGMVLTAGHVSGPPGTRHAVIFPDGSRVSGVTLGQDAELDTGLVQLDAPDEGQPYPFADIGRADAARTGDWTLALGHPGGYRQGRDPVVRLGRVLTLDRRLFITDNTLVGGDSGGPLFDLSGNVIGIHSRIAESSKINLHVPSERFPLGPFLGVIGDSTNQLCRVESVYPDSAAELAGLREGDVVLSFDARPVGSLDSLAELVGERLPGDEVVVEYRRPGEAGTQRALVVIGARPVPMSQSQRRRERGRR